MIRFEQVTKVYDRRSRPALQDVTVEFERGQFVFLVGASGSGKSTFIRLMLREERASAGAVYVAGRNVARLPGWRVPRLRRSIGVVFQDFRLLPNKTVFANVAFAMQVLGKGRGQIRQTVPEVLSTVGLDGKERRLPHELSGGEQQRVAIARAIVNRPDILLADEPTGNLDPETSLGIMAVLDQINENGTTVVMATHDHDIVNQMRRRVVELREGRIVRDEQAGRYRTRPVRAADDWEASAGETVQSSTDTDPGPGPDVNADTDTGTDVGIDAGPPGPVRSGTARTGAEEGRR
ncbi:MULTISPECIES: cell division ATP-binding protein FtsE [Citricoccus]|uniref:cell division ATP-binding protein FtsE n=1 Tax=Citricoccus TaxID=169133 RepID=UPI000255F6AF|nr:cell division ATP-binding protein FtsE [Citricoccus sp. CH26A]